jgi:multidrug efflux pump
MLVDGAIVVIELADRKMGEGLPRREAYAFAAKRMSWPVIASTATTLAVFTPLVFWPGVIGEFMKYLPITVIICLSASLFMALIFIPVIGGIVGKRNPDQRTETALLAAESGDLDSIGGITGSYLRLLNTLLQRPVMTLMVAMSLMIASYAGYAKFGLGVEFFPDVEPKFSMIQIHARGDLSVYEKDDLVRQVEQRILGMDEIRINYARTFNQAGGNNRAEDVIGVIQLEFVDWKQRREANVILDDIRRRTADISGVILELRKEENGPGQGKPINLQISAGRLELLDPTTQTVRDIIDELGGFADVEDNRALPGIEWRLQVDRELAARYGADISLLGNAVQMITNGINIASYRPDDTDEELDIRVRFPLGERSLDQLDQLRIPTRNGMVSISNFVKLVPAPKTGTLERVDAKRVITIQSDVEEGLLVDDQLTRLREALAKVRFDPSVNFTFKGEDEEQRDTMAFLSKAFATAIFLMAIILVTQFNSLYQMLLVLSAIIFSTAGVLLGLLVSAQPFGIVMVGIGIIALAGIVVNNNIVLIDTFNVLRQGGMDSMQAALRTGAQRLRPVTLTAITTVLGLMPMVLSLNIDIVGRTITYGAPSSQWWTQLSAAIAGGLTFATALTLILTPCLLVLGDRIFRNKAAE